MNIGTDPGLGSLTGQVFDAASQPVSGATVTVNRGIYTTTTNGTGNYDFPAIPALPSWEVTATSAGQSATADAAVTSGGTTTQNLTL